MVNTDKLAKAVLSSPGGAAIKQHFRLDTINYAWVKDYVRDKKIREDIQVLQQKIVDNRALPIHKEELKKRFKELVKNVNKFRIEQLGDHLSAVQKREVPLLSEFSIGSIKVSGVEFLPFFMEFSPTEIEEIFSGLPEGVTTKDIEKKESEFQGKILELENVISEELSPQSRWLHRDDGTPEPYPNGCRWTAFHTTWEKVARRFDGKVDIQGHALKTGAESEAYYLLELEKSYKLEPLRSPL
jgi:hypothetical protein